MPLLYIFVLISFQVGDIGSRPHSEIKAWTPPEVPPPVAQSAPPELTQQAKDQGMSLA